MKHLGFIQTAACAALLFAAFSPRSVRADDWNKKTVISFSDAVQVPGATLPAGTYVFKVAESNADRFIVQIFNQREDHVYATVLAIPDVHMTPADGTQVSFYEAPAGQPEPIKAWFYPGDNIGREFVYSNGEAALIAHTADQTVRTDESAVMAQNTTTESVAPIATEQSAAVTEPTVNEEPTVSEEPTTDETHNAEPSPAPVATEPESPAQEPLVTKSDEPPVAADQPPAQDDADASTTSLPVTGSELPLVGLIGLSSIVAALAIRGVRSAS